MKPPLELIEENCQYVRIRREELRKWLNQIEAYIDRLERENERYKSKRTEIQPDNPEP